MVSKHFVAICCSCCKCKSVRKCSGHQFYCVGCGDANPFPISFHSLSGWVATVMVAVEWMLPVDRRSQPVGWMLLVDQRSQAVGWMLPVEQRSQMKEDKQLERGKQPGKTTWEIRKDFGFWGNEKHGLNSEKEMRGGCTGTSFWVEQQELRLKGWGGDLWGCKGREGKWRP